MKKYFALITLLVLSLTCHTCWGAGVEGPRSKKVNTTSQGQPVHSGLEEGADTQVAAQVGILSTEPLEKVAMEQEQEPPKPPPVCKTQAPPRVFKKMPPVVVQHDPLPQPVCYEEPAYSPCEPCVPCEPSESYSFPSWSKYILPTAIAGSALAVSAVRASDSCEEPCGVPDRVLDFFVEAGLGANGESPAGGDITIEILFPDMTIFDTMTLTSPGIYSIQSQLSAATRDFAFGEVFTVNVTSETNAQSIQIDGRVNGQVFDSQSQVSPSVGPLFTFTITPP